MNHEHELQPISDVPQKKVGQVVQDFIVHDEAVKVVVERQRNGNFSIQAYKRLP